MRKSNVILALVAGLLISGCSIDGSILPINELTSNPIATFEKPGGAEFVSGALSKYETTAIRHYKVQASVGHFIAEPRIETAGRNYIVYSSVQGSMLSEQASP